MDENNELRPIMSVAIDTNVYQCIRDTLVESKTKVFTAVNFAMVEAYWNIGRQIEEAVGDRAEYGKGLLQFLSKNLTCEFGKGFTERNLRAMRQFFVTFPIRHALRAELTWTHYRLLMRIDNDDRREFYLRESAESGWTSRQLERQISSFFYERLLATQKSGKECVRKEIFELEPNIDSLYILKDPYILEFLDLKENKNYLESELEQGLINHLQEFLLELGKGFSFVARQKRITTESGEHYYIDLVFYNYILKAGKLTYQDIGQIDFYVRLFNDKIKQTDDNPTIGIVLCAGKDETIAKYSVLADNENLFATKYKLYLPTEDELKCELEREREIIERQQSFAKEDE